MSYEKLNLGNGTVLDQSHLAHIEEGIAAAGTNNLGGISGGLTGKRHIAIYPVTKDNAVIGPQYRLPVIVYHSEQELTEQEKAQARANIGIVGTGKDGDDGYTPVKGTDYWTEADKAEILGDVLEQIPDPEGSVLYTEQTLTEEQKAQARQNIGVPDSGGNADLTGTEAQIVGFDADGKAIPIDFFEVSESAVSEVAVASEVAAVAETTVGSPNLANPATALANTSHKVESGAYTTYESNGYYLFDYIPVEYGKTYCGGVYHNGGWQYSWVKYVYEFDENKNLLSTANFSSSTGICTLKKENTKYVRFAGVLSYSQQLYFGEGDTLPTEFIPFGGSDDGGDSGDGEDSGEGENPGGSSGVSGVKVIRKELIPILETAGNLYDYRKRTPGHSLTNGNPVENTSYDATDFIRVEASAQYMVASYWQSRESWYCGAVTNINCFDINKNFLSAVSVTDGAFTTPENCAYIRFHIAIAAVPEFAVSTLLIKGDTLPRYFIPYATDYRLKDEYVSELVRYYNKWSGKKFVSYGDSITDQGFWQTYVASYFDLIHLKRGVGGSGFVRGVSHWWANADGSYNSSYQTDEEAPEGATLVEACLCSDERINLSIPEDTDLVLIAGGTNDHGGDVTTSPELGEISYEIVDGEPVFDTTTFKNAVCATVYKIMKRCPNAIVMLVTPVNTRGIDQVQTVNGHGLELLDYVHAIKECAEYMSVPCIDVYGESGLNQFNMHLNGNNLHPDDAGHRKMARAVIAKLKAYEPCDYPFVVE